MATHSSVLAWRIQGLQSLVGCRLWGRTETDTTEATQLQQQQQILVSYRLIACCFFGAISKVTNPVSEMKDTTTQDTASSMNTSIFASVAFVLKSLMVISVQFNSVAQSCPTLCDPMNRSTPGLPVHNKLPEFTQTHVHRVSDAIQPSHPLSSPSPPDPNPSQHQSLFQ